MTTHEQPALSPVQRSRRELTVAAELAMELEAISKDELNALAIQLRLDRDILAYRKPARMEKHLSNIGESIVAREVYMQKRRFITKQLANTGLLAAAVGSSNQPPLSHIELVKMPLVDRFANTNPNVNRSVFVDILIANDLHWLSEPVTPKVSTRL